jgi:hypothetical protein
MSNNANQTVRKPTYSSTTFIIIIGVLLLAFVIVYLYNSYKSASLLATNATIAYSICPSYWDSIGNSKCQNTNAIGSCSANAGSNIMDFGAKVFTNVNTGNYAKCKWANACNVTWSGIDRLC